MTEIFAVDPSPDMNDLAKLLLLGGRSGGALPAGTFFRLHFPASNEVRRYLFDATTTSASCFRESSIRDDVVFSSLRTTS